MRLRLQPIRVFCFHQVSAEFDASTMWECDWMQIEEFKQRINTIRKEHTFISISEAYEKLRNDRFRAEYHTMVGGTADTNHTFCESILFGWHP